MRDVPVAHDRQPAHVEHRDAPGLDLQVDGMPGEEAQSHPRHHRLLDRLVARHLHARRGGDARVAEEPFHREAGAGSGLAHEEALLDDPGWIDRRRRDQGMIGRRDDDLGIVRERGRDHLGPFRWPTHDREVHLVLVQLVDHLGAIADREPDARGGVSGLERGQQPGREVLRGADDRDVESTAPQPLERVDALLRLLERARHVTRRVEQFPARLGEVAASPEAFDQGEPGPRFEIANVHRDAGLRHVQTFGRAREGAFDGDGFEDAQLSQRQLADRHDGSASAGSV
jgi:hypothetical protein